MDAQRGTYDRVSLTGMSLEEDSNAAYKHGIKPKAMVP